MKKRKPVALFLAMMVLLTQMTFAAPVMVNSKTQAMDLLSVAGRQYVSGDSLKTFGLTSTVSGNTMTLKHKEVTFTFNANSNAVTVNGAQMTLESKPVIKNKKAYYPLRFVLETMNYTVGFDAKKGQVTLKAITKPEFPVVIKDDKVSYTFKKPVDTVVSLAPSMTEILFAIGAGNKVVARTKYCNYPAAALKVRSVGTLKEPDIEGILNLKPDLVLAATHMNEDAMKLFAKAGIEIATQKSPEKIAEIYALIENLGIITNQDYSARALVSSLKAKTERISSLVSTIPVAKRKSVYYVVGTGNKEFTAGANTFINDIFTKSGADNVANDVIGWSYSLEKLLKHNPEYLFGEGWAKDSMTGSKTYSALSALKNNKFITIDASVFSVPGPRVIDLGMKLVIETLYPQLANQLQY